MSGKIFSGLVALVAVIAGCSGEPPGTATDGASTTVTQPARNDSATVPNTAETGFERLDGYTLCGSRWRN